MFVVIGTGFLSRRSHYLGEGLSLVLSFLCFPRLCSISLLPSLPPSLSLPPFQQPSNSSRESQLTMKPQRTFRENKELLETFHNHFEVSTVVLCCGGHMSFCSHANMR